MSQSLKHNSKVLETDTSNDKAKYFSSQLPCQMNDMGIWSIDHGKSPLVHSRTSAQSSTSKVKANRGCWGVAAQGHKGPGQALEAKYFTVF